MSDGNYDEHLRRIPHLVDDEYESDSSADNDQLEIVSDTEENENLLFHLNNYLNLESPDNTALSADDDHEENVQKKPDDEGEQAKHNDPGISITSTIISSSTSALILVNDVFHSSQLISTVIDKFIGGKRKRRQWSIKEKLLALSLLGKNHGNKRLTANQYGCSRYQLSQWLKAKTELETLSKQKYGNKRKRLNDAGSKIRYMELNHRLLLWFRQKRTFIDPQAFTTIGTTTTTTIKRERVTFRQLQRQGKLLSCELRHDCPSTKWFARFMRRHRLSLQKPKRNHKLPLSEVYSLVNQFYDYIRRNITWVPSRGPMGACLPRDVCNMDESPLALFGDQSKVSINDINTPNDIDGCISNKRFATVILTVFGDDNTRVALVLLFKGKGHVSAVEKAQYTKGVEVFFTPKVVNNRVTMNKYLGYWMSKVNDRHPKLFIADRPNTHLDEQSIRSLRKKNIVVAVVPGGCTMYIQALDVYVFSVFKNHYHDCAEEYIEKVGGRSKIKLTAAQSRILCTRLTSSAWKRTIASIDFNKTFRDIGYTWTDNITPVKLHSLPGYIYDPSDRNLINQVSNDRVIIEDINDGNSIPSDTTDEKNLKQLKLTQLWNN